jgi:hypothetical protein
MKLIATTEHFKGSDLTAQLIEKDYYITEALRIIVAQWPQQVVFKEGTSLSKRLPQKYILAYENSFVENFNPIDRLQPCDRLQPLHLQHDPSLIVR